MNKDNETSTPICAVLGLGFLGSSIVGELARCGCIVHAYDRNPQQRILSLPLEIRNLYKNPDDITKIMKRVHFKSTLADAVKNAQYVIEAIVERLDVKQQVFHELDQLCDASVVLSTNTLQLSLDDISKTCNKHPERVLGLRFLHPVYLISWVEMTIGKTQHQDSVNSVQKLIKFMDKRTFLYTDKNTQRIRLSEHEANRFQQMTAIKCGLDWKPKQAFTPPKSRYGHGHHSHGHGNCSHGSHYHEQKDEQKDEQKEEKKEEPSTCSICMDKKPDSMFAPCGHLCACFECATQIHQQKKICPICRADITSVYRVYSC